jgi:hypothetical protein
MGTYQERRTPLKRYIPSLSGHAEARAGPVNGTGPAIKNRTGG